MATLSAKEVAARFETDGRTLRKFLRADARSNDATDALPGKGGRYAIEAKELRSLRRRFDAWVAAKAPAPADDAAEGDAPADA